MTRMRLLVHTIFLILLPVVVAWFGISTGGAVALVVVALAWRWAISMSVFIAPEKVPHLELETIAASHFVEKVRWCMDRLGVDYTERQMAGTLGAFFLGRTVPVLRIHTGKVRSSIGDSPDILRYLWGTYAATHAEQAKFLEPTEARLELEQRIDRYGVDLQIWIYYHILDDRSLTLHAWGCDSSLIAAWQRYTIIAIFPVLRLLVRNAFRVSPKNYATAVDHVETILAEIDAQLADGRTSILGGASIDFVDITFASISGLWLQPPEYGRDKADQARIEPGRWPPALRADVTRWKEKYPNATAFIHRLYQQDRQAGQN